MGIKALVVVITFAYITYHILTVNILSKSRSVVFNHQPGPCRTLKLKDRHCRNQPENDNDCEAWAERGECEANRDWMLDHCAKSCGHCESPQDMLRGSADFVEINSGKYMISSGLNCFDKLIANQSKGLYVFDMNKPHMGARPVNLEMDEAVKKEINPHGISLWKDEAGKVIIFVINSHDSVERFEYFEHNNSLVHLETISDSLFNVLWSLEVVGERSFFASNMGYFRQSFWAIVERYFLLRMANVVFYDGTEAKQVVGRFLHVDGIKRSADGRYLYLGNYGDMTFETYTILPNYDLKKAHSMPLNALVNKIQMDRTTSDLIVVVAASPGETLDYITSSDNTPLAPSQVLRVQIEDGIPTGPIKQLISTTGVSINGASVATVYNGKLMIGSLFETTLYCDIIYE